MSMNDDRRDETRLRKANMPRARRVGGLLGALALILGGCATTAQAPEELVVERAQARLDSLLAGDMTAAYQYLSPGYRSSVSLAAWQRDWLSRKVRWDEAKVTGSECEDELCRVTVALGFSVYSPVPGLERYQGQQEMVEDWARIDGGWYLVP